jgi:hypothetical protein
MLREIIFLALGALFGLGATMAGAVAPTYLNLSSWGEHWLFWGGIALMTVMAIDAASLLLWQPQLMTALLFTTGLLFLAAAAITHLSPRTIERTVASKAILISIGNGAPYETVEPAGVNRTRTFRAKIENNTDIEISNGKLQVINLDPAYRGNRDWLLRDGITIGPHRYTFVEVVAYNEGTSKARPGTFVRLIVPAGSGFFAEAYPNLPVEPHTFYLKFSTLEGGISNEVYCKLYVDSNHILHLENWGDSSKTQTTGQLDSRPDMGRDIERHQISLFEAATRAYEQTRHRVVSGVAEAFEDSPDDVLTWYSNAMARPRNGKLW